MMRSLIGSTIAIVFMVLGAAHAYWAAGGRAGWALVIPSLDGQPAFRPTRLGTAAVALALFAAGAIVAAAAGRLALPIPPLTGRVLAGLLALVLFARVVGDFRWYGMFKRVRDTAFARLDTLVYTPLCAVLGAGIAAIVLLPHP